AGGDVRALVGVHDLFLQLPVLVPGAVRADRLAVDVGGLGLQLAVGEEDPAGAGPDPVAKLGDRHRPIPRAGSTISPVNGPIVACPCYLETPGGGSCPAR